MVLNEWAEGDNPRCVFTVINEKRDKEKNFTEYTMQVDVMGESFTGKGKAHKKNVFLLHDSVEIKHFPCIAVSLTIISMDFTGQQQNILCLKLVKLY